MKVESLKHLINDLAEKEIFEGIGVGIGVMDTNFKVLYQNSMDRELSGDHVGEFCYRSYENRDAVCEGCPLVLTFKDGLPHTAERTSPSKNGTITIEITASPVKDRTGRIIAGIEIVRDITESKRAEEKLKESEERYRNVYDTAPLAFVIWDRETRVTGWNDQAEKLFGWTREEIAGQNFFDYIIPESARIHVQEVVKLLLDGRLPSHSVNENITKDGRTIVCEWNNTIIRDSRGGITEVISLALDITERRKMEKLLEETVITDDLTGLLNRRGFFPLADQQCRIADRTKRGLSLLFVDLNKLKQINDELGHESGDMALKDTADILKKTFRESDIIARMGGDEFAVLITEPSLPGIDQIIMDHLKNNLDKHNEQGHRKYKLSLSMGISNYNPVRPCSVADLLNSADVLMYEDKKRYKPRPLSE